MANRQKRVLAAIVSFNRCEQLAKTIGAVLNQEGAACDVMVVDNGSSDGTREMVAGQFASRGVQFRELGENTGCAGGINYACRSCVIEGYDVVWIMDDDVVPEPSALKELMLADHVLNGKWGFLSSAAYWKDGRLSKANIQKKGAFRFVTNRDYLGGPVRIHMASICSLMVNSAAIRDVGLPIAEYFFYTEDYEFTSRIARRYPCYLVPNSRVLHDMKVNGKANLVNDSEDRMWRYRYLYRNDVHCYRRQGLVGWAYLAAKAGYTTVNVIVKEKRDKVGKLKVLFSGLKEGLRFNPAIEKVHDSGNEAESQSLE